MHALCHITEPSISDNDFSKHLEQIKEDLFPEKTYKEHQGELLNYYIADPDIRTRQHQQSLQSIIREVSESINLPFISRFHDFFLKRKWEIPYTIPRRSAQDIFRLYPEYPFPEIDEYNYSKYYGNFNHFINVVAALARLIMYFQDDSNTKFLTQAISQNTDPQYNINMNDIASDIKYDKSLNTRAFKLMLAGFYHDIGKTIVDARHGMEGALLLASSPNFSRYQINTLIKDAQYTKGAEYTNFDREDWFFINDLVLYHDQYGTLSTGEDGYLQLVDIIERFSRYTMKFGLNHGRIKHSRQCIFDLWLLNIADIMVSFDHKWDLQKDLLEKEKADKRIRDFFTTNGSKGLLHDLGVTFYLLNFNSGQRHPSDLADFRAEAHKLSLNHVIERLRRLMVASLRKVLKEYTERGKEITQASSTASATAVSWEGDSSIAAQGERGNSGLQQDAGSPQGAGVVSRADTSADAIRKIAQNIQNLSEEVWDAIIIRAIDAVAEREDFSKRFSWIGKSDYALGFFETIAKFAFENMNGTDNAGWRYINRKGIKDPDFIAQIDAEIFADNYVMTVIQILGHLLCREPYIEHRRNIEFSDARNRIASTSDSFKLKQIIDLEGPSRSRIAVDFILQTIYIYN